MTGDWEATKWAGIFFVWIAIVTGGITILSGDPNPIVGTVIAALIFIPMVAFADWQYSR